MSTSTTAILVFVRAVSLVVDGHSTFAEVGVRMGAFVLRLAVYVWRADR